MTPDDYAASVMREGTPLPHSVKVDDDEEAEKAAMMFGLDIIWDASDEEPPKSIKERGSAKDSEFKYEHYPRYTALLDTHGYDVVVARLNAEYAFFHKTNNITSLDECAKLITKFKENDVIWGVGRGSACASLLLYLIEVHDVDPIKYEIPFSELSKEIEYEFG